MLSLGTIGLFSRDKERLSQRTLDIIEALFLRLALRDIDFTRTFIKSKLPTKRLATGQAYCFRHLNDRNPVLPKCTLLRFSCERGPSQIRVEGSNIVPASFQCDEAPAEAL
jgi:hypothetical protein